jgi:hypothetical protein
MHLGYLFQHHAVNFSYLPNQGRHMPQPLSQVLHLIIPDIRQHYARPIGRSQLSAPYQVIQVLLSQYELLRHV